MSRPIPQAFRRFTASRRSLTGPAAFALVVLMAIGCVVESRTSSWDDFDKLADPKPGEPTAAARDRAAAPRGWTIPVAEFTGPDRLKEAYRLAASLRESGQLADVWFDELGDAARVNVGRFRLSGDADAKAGLAAVRAAEVNGRRPYRDAELEPITSAGGTVSEFDLAQHSGFRTLLVALFDEGYDGNRQVAAERYAQQLREGGPDPGSDTDPAEAYFYHGPTQSLVTVGLFTYADFVPVNGVDTYGPRIREQQERFPAILRNGQPIPRQGGADEETEPTVIVNVP